MKRTVVIGASRKQFLPAKVCEYTIKRVTSVPVDIVHTYNHEYGTSPYLRSMNRTGFSFVRFAVPELAGYQGRAVYLDSDMLVMRDLADLLHRPMGEALVMRPKNQTAVLLYDCARLPHWQSSDILGRLEAGEYKYRELMDTLYEPKLAAELGSEWNHLDRFDKHSTALLHYTDMGRQPWLKEGHPLAGIWYESLRGALRAEFLSSSELEAEVKAGNVGAWLLKETAK